MRLRASAPTLGLLLSAIIALGGVLASAPAAHADQLTVFSCHDPAGNAVGNDGWSVQRTADDFMTAADTCAHEDSGYLLLELGANGSGYPNAAQVQWVFTAPAWGSIASYSVGVAGSYGVPGGQGEGQAFIDASDESDPIYDYRNLGAGPAGAATISRTPPAPASSITANASCDGQLGRCPPGVAVSHLYISSARMVLNDPTTPTVSDVTGPLLASGSGRGESEVSFNAADSGPGIYSGHLVVDGVAQPASILNSNNGWCVNLGQTSDGTRSFAHPDPCLQSVSASLPLDTTGLRDGQHAVKLIVEDASGNAAIGWSGMVTTDNAPADAGAPTIAAPSEVSAGTALTAQPGSWSASAGAGAVSYSYQWQDCNIEGNSCTAIAGAESSTYDATTSDIGHTLRVQVTAADTDGSATAASGASSGVSSVPQSSTGPTGGTATVDAPNGSGASEHAQLHLHVPAAVGRSFAQRALKITGSLANAQGQPIAGAQLQVLEQPAGSSAAHVIGQVGTSSTGAFMASVTAGPSRVIEIAYRAFSADAGYAAAAQVHESVAAGVQLQVSPRGVSRTGRIILRGRVLGPIPEQGVVVELLVRYRGQWEPLRTPRTSPGGRFTAVYQFEGAVGRFPFKAEFFAGQSGFPYASGQSTPVTVRSG